MTSSQKMTIRILAVVGLVAVVVAGGAIYSIAQPNNGGDATDADNAAATPGSAGSRPLPVETVIVKQVDSYQVQRKYTGVVRAARTADLSFERGGRIIEVKVDEGQQVADGQVLAMLDTRHLTAQRQQLQAQRRQAVALLDELKKGARQEQLLATQAEIDSLTADREMQRLTLDRRRGLYEKRIISKEEYDQSRFAYDAATGRLQSAQQRYQEMKNGARQEKITAQQAALDQLDAQLRSLEYDFADAELKAPFAGRIAARHIDEGEVAARGQNAFRLIENEQLEAWVGLPPSSAAKLDPAASFDIEVGSQTYKATLHALLPLIDGPTRTRTAIFKFPAAAIDGITPGQTVRLSVPTLHNTQGFWLPSTALAPGARGLWSCYVVEKVDDASRVSRADVEVIYTAGDRVLVRGGLMHGDRVVTGGAHRLAQGQVVAEATSEGKRP